MVLESKPVFGLSLRPIRAVLEKAQTLCPVTKGCLGEQLFLFSLDSAFLTDGAASAVPGHKLSLLRQVLLLPLGSYRFTRHHGNFPKLSSPHQSPAQLGGHLPLCFFQLVGGETQLKAEGELPLPGAELGASV